MSSNHDLSSIMTTPRSDSGSARGQALIEFTLTMLLLFILVFGIIDWGRAMYAYSMVSGAAKEAARFAAVYPDGDIVGVAQQRAVGVQVQVTVEPITGTAREIEVTVIHEFDPVFPLVPDMTLSSTARQFREVLEGQP